MAVKDFQANQIRATKIIGSGSGTGPSILIYSSSNATNFIGGVNANLLTNVGTDVFLFVSGAASDLTGSNNQRSNVALFGGDLVVSGTLFAERTVVEVDLNQTGSLTVSGSLFVKTHAHIAENLYVTGSTVLADLSVSDLTSGRVVIAGAGGSLEDSGNLTFDGTDLTVTSAKVGDLTDNRIVIAGSAGALEDSANLTYDGTTISLNDAVTINESAGNNDFRVETRFKTHAIFTDAGTDQVLILSGGAATSYNEAGAPDVNFYVSGSAGSKGTATRGTAVFGGDLVISGTAYDGTGMPLGGGWTDDGTIVRLNTATDYVGIGTTSPASKLQVSEGGVGVGYKSTAISITRTGPNSQTASGSLLFLDTNGSRAAGLELGPAGLERPFVLFNDDPQGIVELTSNANSTGIYSASLFWGKAFGGNYGSPARHQVLILSGGASYKDGSTVYNDTSTSPDPKGFGDINFWVSGTVDSRNSTTKGTSGFGGDVVVSGSSYVIGNAIKLEDPSYPDSNIFIAANSGGGGSAQSVGINVSVPREQLHVSSSNNANSTGIRVEGPNAAGKVTSLTLMAKSGNGENDSQMTTLYNVSGSSITTSVLGNKKFQNEVDSSGNVKASYSYLSNVGRVGSDWHPRDFHIAYVEGKMAVDDLALPAFTLTSGSGPTTSGAQVFILSGSSKNELGTAHDPRNLPDINFWVSGTIGSRGSNNRGAALFAGDTVVSGTLIAGEGTNYYGGAAALSLGGTAPFSKIVLEKDTTTAILLGQMNPRIALLAGGAHALDVNAGDIWINSGLSDRDFIVSSDNKAYAFLVDAGKDQVLILSGGAVTSYDEASGNDVAFYVSGSVGSKNTATRGTAVFGGDVHISGSITSVGTSFVDGSGAVNRIATWADANTLTSDSDFTWNGTLFNVQGDTNLNGTVVINQSGADKDFRVESLNKQDALKVDASRDQILILSGGAATSVDEGSALDAALYVSGAVRSRGTSTRGATVIGGDLVSSGVLYVGGNSWDDGATAAHIVNAHDTQAKISFRNSGIELLAGTGGGIHPGGEHNYLLVNTIAAKSLDINVMAEDIDFTVSSDTGRIIKTNAGTHQITLGSNVTPASDAFMFVSGAAGSKDSTTKGTSVFGGDVMVSGSTYVSGNLQIHTLTGSGRTPFANANDLVIDANADAGISILTPDSKNAYLVFGNTASAAAAYFSWEKSSRKFTFNGSSTIPSTFTIRAGKGTSADLVVTGADKADKQILFMSGGYAADADVATFADTNFYVSGAIGSKDSSTRGTAVFGGDLVTSGNIHIKKGSVIAPSGYSDDLVIEGSDSTGISILTPSDQVGRIYFGDSDNEQRGYVLYDHSIDMMKFSVANGNRLVINSTGDVGIGVTDPDEKLEVAGRLHLSTETATPSAPSDGDGGIFYVKSDGKPYFRSFEQAEVDLTQGSGGSGSGSGITVVSGSASTGSVTSLNLDMLGYVMDLGGGTVAVTGTIGPPEDGVYTDGLFSTFNANTPIGTAIDKINEVLKFLSPSPSPDLSNVNSEQTGATAKLAFGSANAVSGYTAVGSSAGLGSAVNVNGSYTVATSSANIRAATFIGSTVITGVLNSNVAADTYSNGVINYSGSTFGNANEGQLILDLNGTSGFVTVDLTQDAAGSGKPGAGTAEHLNGRSGIVKLSQTGSAYQSSAASFGLFQNRTGEIKIDPSSMRNGWNYARVRHVIGSSTKTTNYIEWVVDASGSAITVTNPRLTGEVGTTLLGSVYISGIRYATGAQGSYLADINNYYQNVFTNETVTFTGTNCAIPSATIPDTSGGSGANDELVSVTGSFTTNVTELLGGTIGVNLSVPHVLKTNVTNAGSVTSGRWLIFSASNTSTNLVESFDRENFRIVSASYDTQGSVTGGPWNSMLHFSGSAAQTDGLAFYNNRLYAPVNTLNSGDFRSVNAGGSYFGDGYSYDENPNYSGLTSGTKTFYRYFKNETGADARDFKIVITGDGSTIVPNSTSISSEAAKIRIHAKIPGSTGFLDVGSEFVYNTGTDGSGGRIGNLDATIDGSGATNNFSFGTGSFANNEYVVLKIEADADWTGHLENIAVTIPAVGVTAVPEAPNVANANTATAGGSCKLSFGPSKGISGYTNVGSAGVGSVDLNGLYSVTSDGDGDMRLGALNGATTVTGIVNDSTTANGNAYPANSFGTALTGSLILEVNGSDVVTANLYDTGFGTAGNSQLLDGDGAGFIDVSVATVGRNGDSLPDYRRFWRSGSFQIPAAAQQNGWNYARVKHDLLNGTVRETNYIEWVNDPDSNSMAIDNATYSSYFADDVLYYQSGVKYLIDPTGSLAYRVTNGYTNVYSNLSSALAIGGTSNITITKMSASGSGVTDASESGASMGYPALLTTTDSQTQPISVTGSCSFSRSESLPGTWGSTSYNISATVAAMHPINTLQQATVTRDNFLVYSGSLTSGIYTSNINTNEVFGREDFRLQSGSFDTQAATGSMTWDSTVSLESGGSTYNTGMLIYNNKLCSPQASNLPDSGDFRDITDGGTLTSAEGNVDYSSLSNAERNYYRAFKNNTSSDQADVSITLYGDATLVPRQGAGSQTPGANKYFHMDIKIPGKTGWMDCARPADGSTADGSGALAGDRDGNVDGSGATNISDFQTAFVAGTAAVDGAEHFIIRIVADKQWTGYISRFIASW